MPDKSRQTANLVSSSNISIDAVNNRTGIGSASPQEKLDVQGGNGFVRIGEVFTGYNGITLNNSILDNSYNILSSPSDTTLYLNRPAGNMRFRIANSDQMGLDASGNLIISNNPIATGTLNQPLQVTGGAYVSSNVGIATTNPTSRLQVVGDARISGVVTATTYNGSNVSVSGVVTATAYFGDGGNLSNISTGTDITSSLFS